MHNWTTIFNHDFVSTLIYSNLFTHICVSIDTCSNGGVCKNRKGSFSCECRNSTTSGKLCQFREKVCNPNPCDKAECYPKEVKQRYECLADVKAVAMVFTLDDARLPFEKWMLYDVAKEIENAINEAAAEQTREGK